MNYEEELKETRKRIERFKYIIKSAEYKLERCEPLSDEFEGIVTFIQNVKDEKEQAEKHLKELCG